MIAIVHYGLGNLHSVRCALESLGADTRLCERPEELAEAERLVLPGVGAFRDAMANLRARGWLAALEEQVLRRGKPILGICLGLQVLARGSEEGGSCAGLGWLAADVVRMRPAPRELRVPQIGWNNVEYRADSPLFRGLPPQPDFYFVHSYHLRCDNPGMVDAVCDYGGPVTAAVRSGRIAATQFHPEKSQEFGLQVLENFLRWTP